MNQPIRVLHILQRMEAGGTQALLMNLYRNIDRSRVQFVFLVVYKEKQFYEEEIRSLVGRLYKFSFREDLNLLKFKQDLKHFFSEHKEYKIVHCHAFTFGYFCLKAAKKAKIPVRIAHSHNNETVHDIKYIPKLIMQKLFTINATDFFACSEAAGRYLFKQKEFKVLNNAIDSKKFIANQETRQAIKEELALERKFVVGHVGRLHPQKNHMFLLDIFWEIKQLKENAVLLLVGTGELEKQIREKVSRLGLEQNVIFLRNRKDMYRIYQAMDIFVFPSLFEGLGIVAIEAQASGIPAICSDGLPKEANVSPLFYRCSLSSSAKTWAQRSLEASESEYKHLDMHEYIVDHGYDLMRTADFIQQYYIRKYE